MSKLCLDPTNANFTKWCSMLPSQPYFIECTYFSGERVFINALHPDQYIPPHETSVFFFVSHPGGADHIELVRLKNKQEYDDLCAAIQRSYQFVKDGAIRQAVENTADKNTDSILKSVQDACRRPVEPSPPTAPSRHEPPSDPNFYADSDSKLSSSLITVINNSPFFNPNEGESSDEETSDAPISTDDGAIDGTPLIVTGKQIGRAHV